jgi:hypothetical protein
MDWVELLNGVAAGFAGIAVGAGWVGAVVAPNATFDGLDYSRADKQTREILLRASPVAVVGLLLAALLGAVSGSPGGAILAAIAGVGFLLNAWTLSPRPTGARPPGVRQRHKTRRIVAVYLSMMFGGVAAVAVVLLGVGI